MRYTVLPIVVLLALTVGCSSAASESRGSIPAPAQATPAARLEDTRALDARIEAIIDDADGYEVGVAIADVSGADIRVLGDESPFFAASTAKVLTASAYYHLVETGEKTLDEPLGAGDAETQIEAMINQSDNASWLLLMQSIGYPELIEYATSIGVVYDPEENLLTTGDMARLLQSLSSGDLLDSAHTEQLLEYMQETNNEILIPAALDPGISVHHKYGQIDGYLHDAALLGYRGTDQVLVVYTNRTDYDGDLEQVDLIQAVAREVSDALVAGADRDD